MADPITAAADARWGMKAAGWLTKPIIMELVKKASSYLGNDASEKLKDLEIKLLVLERVKEADVRRPDLLSFYRLRLELLFKDLKSAFYEAEDILDDVEYQHLKRQIQDDEVKSHGDAHPVKKKVKKKLQSIMLRCRPKKQESGTSKNQLKKSLQKIQKVINDACQIVERLNLPSVANSNGGQVFPANSRSAATNAAPPKVFGRDKEHDKIIAMIYEKEYDGQQNNNSDLPFSVLGIYGIGGSGKSTLAQIVYASVKEDKQENKAGHFDIHMWVHVSHNFDVDSIYRELIECATGILCPELNNRNALQEYLVEKLRGKRFFLVLDDVWYNSTDAMHQGELQQMLDSLKFGQTGSKILVTSRSRDALTALGAVENRCIPISDLDEEAFFEMFMHYALRDGNDTAEFKRIGADIAKKLKRSPLAARIVAAQLCRRQDVEFWRTTNDRDLLNDTVGALRWSYQQLHGQVRRCFAYCSIYPRRHHLKRMDLVQLWIAEGFIKTSYGEELDDIGQKYFDELLSTSFLQLGQRRVDFGFEDHYFTVHDLLRDLAEEDARGDCFRIDKDFREEVPLDVRHLFVQSCDRKMVTEKISEFRNLRTLIFDYHIPFDYEVFQSMLERLQKLRVLILRFTKHDGGHNFSVPACIGQLKHLRYLHFDVYHDGMLILPDSIISELYRIQLLHVSNLGDVDFSGGNNMHQLVNLRCLSVSQNLSIPNIGRLKWLQMLPYFNVRKEQEYGLRQLKDLNKLEGKLSLMNLENVESKKEAIEARLADKERLTELVLVWNDKSCSPEVEAEVLEGLCPPKYLEKLEISDYHGSTYPNWMVSKQNSGPTYLCSLWLKSCMRLKPAPELFEVFIHLRRFKLSFSNWHALPGNMEQLTSLQCLGIDRCLNIRSLPPLPQSLEEFQLWYCNKKFMRSCETINDPNWEKIQHIPKKSIYSDAPPGPS